MASMGYSKLIYGVSFSISFETEKKDFTRFNPKSGESLVVQGECYKIVISLGEHSITLHQDADTFISEDMELASRKYFNLDDYIKSEVARKIFDFMKELGVSQFECEKKDLLKLVYDKKYHQEVFYVGVPVVCGCSWREDSVDFKLSSMEAAKTIFESDAKQLAEKFGVDLKPSFKLITECN